MDIVRRKLLLDTIGTKRVKDKTKFKNNINNVTCEAKLIKTFPSIVPYIAATSPYNVLPFAFHSRLTCS